MAQFVRNPHDQLLTVKELASYLKCHTSTIYRLLYNGTLPAFKIGSDWRFSLKSVDDWIRDTTTRTIRR